LHVPRQGRPRQDLIHMGRACGVAKSSDLTGLCTKLKIIKSMGRVGFCFDNAAVESFSTLE
jgi:transposase InsO family protein